MSAALLGLFTASGVAYAAPKDVIEVQTPLDGSGSSAKETNAGDLLADAVRQTGHADIGLVPADDIAETTIAPGSVSASKLTALLRHPEDAGDTIVVLTLTGAQVLHALELGLGQSPAPFAGFWQVSGLQVRYDTSQPPGKRISLAGAKGSEISAQGTYTLATTRAEALGDLGYFRVWSKKDITQDTGVALAQSLTAYAAAHKTLSVSTEGRLTAAR